MPPSFSIPNFSIPTFSDLTRLSLEGAEEVSVSLLELTEAYPTLLVGISTLSVELESSIDSGLVWSGFMAWFASSVSPGDLVWLGNPFVGSCTDFSLSGVVGRGPCWYPKPGLGGVCGKVVGLIPCWGLT